MELKNIGRKIRISKCEYNSIKEFQESSQEDQNKWCSWCGCEGGCCLCDDLSNFEIDNSLE